MKKTAEESWLDRKDRGEINEESKERSNNWGGVLNMQPETQLGDVDARMIHENVIQRINKIKAPDKPASKPP